MSTDRLRSHDEISRPSRLHWSKVGLLLAFAAVLLLPIRHTSTLVARAQTDDPAGNPPLSPYWGPEIQARAETISALATSFGFHPDFLAAVLQQTLDDPVTLMLSDPATAANQAEAMALLRWETAVLSYVVQQSGGDLYTALAAYHGGWSRVASEASRDYAARVLDSYGRALVVRAGLPPDIAGQWTLAVEIEAGNVPPDGRSILGDPPFATGRAYAGHTVYAFTDGFGRAYHVRGYAVPLGLSGVPAGELAPGDVSQYDPTRLEAPLRARLGDRSVRVASGDERVMFACLLSLDRLRGQVASGDYAPSNCPNIGR